MTPELITATLSFLVLVLAWVAMPVRTMPEPEEAMTEAELA